MLSTNVSESTPYMSKITSTMAATVKVLTIPQQPTRPIFRARRGVSLDPAIMSLSAAVLTFSSNSQNSFLRTKPLKLTKGSLAATAVPNSFRASGYLRHRFRLTTGVNAHPSCICGSFQLGLAMQHNKFVLFYARHQAVLFIWTLCWSSVCPRD